MQGGTRSTIAIWVVAAVLAGFAAMRLLGGGSAPAPVSIDGAPVSGSASTDGSTGTLGGAEGGSTGGAAGRDGAAGGELYVHVAGAVRRPGLIRVPPDTRVASALERAGGPTRRADLTLVNLAARVQDGQQIVVPAAAPGRGMAAGGAAAPPGSKIHLSTATVEQLDEIDGLGPTLAKRIVDYRDAHGGFRSVEELSEVEGIGEKRLASLREAVQL